MMKAMIGFVAAIMVVFSAAFTKAPSPVPPSSLPSAVKVEIDGRGHGSGVHLGDGYILTAGHVVTAGKHFTVVSVDGEEKEAEVLSYNEAYDFALIRVKEYDHLGTAPLLWAPVERSTPISLRSYPSPFEDVTMWGKVSSEEKKKGMWLKVQVINLGAGPGSSGGGVMNEEGQVVGILVGGVKPFSSLSLMVPSSVICDGLGLDKGLFVK